jgi:DNA invertase Pin-like site-specific DNA recombinase
MTRHVAAYLRVSHAEEDGRSFAEQQEGQRQAIARLAERTLPGSKVVEYIDWDRSADPEKEHKRDAFNAMLAAIERGEVTAVYARSLDRLYRSMKTFTRLTELCERHGVRVETEREGLLGGDGSPMAQAFARITAVFANLELDTAKARARSRVARQRAAGVRLGQAPYGDRPGEDWERVIEAFKAEGSYQGATRRLIADGIPSRRAHLPNRKGMSTGQTWSASTVRSIVHHRAPELVPARTIARSRVISIRLFTRLLICPHDGSYLTSQVGNGRTIGYLCREALRAPDGQHPRPYAIREGVIRDWAKRATANIISRVVEPVFDDGIETSLTELHGKRQRIGVAYVDGVFGEDQYKAQLAAIDEAIASHEGLQRASATWRMGVTWSAPVGEVNAALRDLLVGIQLGWVESEGPVRGRHSSVTRALVPVGGVWRRQPILHLDDEWASTVPDPAAKPRLGGWYLQDLPGDVRLVVPSVELPRHGKVGRKRQRQGVAT